MRRHHLSLLAGAACALLVGGGALPVAALADGPEAADQARLDAAIEAFEQRMTEAGWVGEPVDDDDDDDDDDDEADDDSALGDDELTECFGELATVFENGGDEFPGQTGTRESAEFTYRPEGAAAPETTEEFSFELDAEETAAAIAVSVDDANAGLLDSYVDTIGAKETGDCIREAMEAEMTGDEEMPVADLSVDVSNEADLGIGDRSSRLTFGFGAELMGMELLFDMDMYLARSGNDLVVLIHGTFGDVPTMSPFDPLAELQTIVDSL